MYDLGFRVESSGVRVWGQQYGGAVWKEGICVWALLHDEGD